MNFSQENTTQRIPVLRIAGRLNGRQQNIEQVDTRLACRYSVGETLPPMCRLLRSYPVPQLEFRS